MSIPLPSLRTAPPLSSTAAGKSAAVLLGIALLGAGTAFLSRAQDAPAPVPPAQASPAAAPVPDANAAADAQVEGLLFFASDDPKAPDQEETVAMDAAVLRRLEDRVRKVYPFHHYHLIGRHTQKVFKEYESWVVPSKDLCLKIDSRGPAEGGGVNLHLQLWQDTRVLVKSDPVLQPGKPIIVGGPGWRGGRLIFMVMLKE